VILASGGPSTLITIRIPFRSEFAFASPSPSVKPCEAATQTVDWNLLQDIGDGTKSGGGSGFASRSLLQNTLISLIPGRTDRQRESERQAVEVQLMDDVAQQAHDGIRGVDLTRYKLAEQQN